MAGTGSRRGILLLNIQVVLPENLLVKTYSNAYPQKHHKALYLDRPVPVPARSKA
jgi:hypothetical protein